MSAKRKTDPPHDNPPEATPTFEEALARLEALVERLEDGEVPLEESLKAYAEGTRLVRSCLEQLERAETVIRELTETAGGFRLDPSSVGEDSA